jgi:hypothetical protein
MLTYDIPAHLRGDTWSGISSIVIQTGGVPVDLTNAIIIMQVREEVDSPVVLELSTTNGAVQIANDPTIGTFSFLPLIVDIPFDSYIYDIQITLQTGYVKTYLTGSWEILPDITN